MRSLRLCLRRSRRRRPEIWTRATLTVLWAVGMSAVCAATGVAQQAVPDKQAVPDTPAEAEDYLAFTPESEIGEFLAGLRAAGGHLHVDTIAWQGDLPIVLARLPGKRQAAKRPAVLVVGLQHGDEQAGKEAALRLIRDAAFGALGGVLADMDLLVMPALNPWGGSQRTRFDPDLADLNRDHMRLTSAATRALHEVFVRYEPHAVLDLHELGPVGYDVQIGVPTHPNVEPRLIEFARFFVLPQVVRDLAEGNVTFHEYVSSHPEPPETGEFLTYAPIAANNARNVFALSGAVSFLVETASTREIAGLGGRTDRLLSTVVSLLRGLALHKDELVSRVEAARGRMPFTTVLEARNVADPRKPTLTWRVRNRYGSFSTETIHRWRPLVQPVLEVSPPVAYLLPPAELELVELLTRHGIPVRRLVSPVKILTGQYQLLARPGAAEPAAESAAVPTEAARSADDLIDWDEREVPAGTWVVVPQAPFARLLLTLAEPYSQDGWFAFRSPAEGPASEAQGPIARIGDPADLPALLRATRPLRDSDMLLAE
ncbi:MAG: hypothetical protein ABFS14_07175 [Gemmatimonadota bacterium]